MRHAMMRVFATAAAPASYDADAQAMFDKRAAVSDEPSAAYKQAISDLVTDIKAISGFWDTIIQLVVMAGATTVNGARQSIKGLDLVNLNGNFVDGDIGIKTGSLGNASNRAWDTGYLTSAGEGFGQNNIHAYCYVSTIPATQVRSLFGHAGSTSGATGFIHRLSGTTHSPRARYITSQSITPASATAVGGYGVSRSVLATHDALAAGVGFNLTQQSNAFSATPRMFIHARSGNTTNTPESFSDSGILIWALGTATTLTDYNTPVDDFITAINAI